jgi:hypothetical protein
MTEETDGKEAPNAGDGVAEIRIVIGGDGQMKVGWTGLPKDKVVLFGLLEVAKDILRLRFEREAEDGRPRIIPAKSRVPFGNGH